MLFNIEIVSSPLTFKTSAKSSRVISCNHFNMSNIPLWNVAITEIYFGWRKRQFLQQFSRVCNHMSRHTDDNLSCSWYNRSVCALGEYPVHDKLQIVHVQFTVACPYPASFVYKVFIFKRLIANRPVV